MAGNKRLIITRRNGQALSSMKIMLSGILSELTNFQSQVGLLPLINHAWTQPRHRKINMQLRLTNTTNVKPSTFRVSNLTLDIRYSMNQVNKNPFK